MAGEAALRFGFTWEALTRRQIGLACGEIVNALAKRRSLWRMRRLRIARYVFAMQKRYPSPA